MESKKLSIAFFVGLTIFLVCGGIATNGLGPVNTSILPEGVSPSQEENDFSYLLPLTLSNETAVAAIAGSGDGTSWENAYIIENKIIENNETQVGLRIANTSQYITLRNIRFYNSYPGVEPVSLLVENASHIQLDGCSFRSYIDRPSYGIKIEQSHDILISDVTVTDYYYGVSLQGSYGCMVAGSHLRDQRYSQLKVKDCTDINITNNQFSAHNIPADQGSVDAINAWNMSLSLVVGNTVELEDQWLFFWECEGLTITSNEVPEISFTECRDFQLAANEFHGGVELIAARHFQITKNQFVEGVYGIAGDNVYNFSVYKNQFTGIIGEVFHFHYYSMEPYTTDPYWLEIPQNTAEDISYNKITIRGPGIWRGLPANIAHSHNTYTPQFGYFLVALVSMVCMAAIANAWVINRKKARYLGGLPQRISKVSSAEFALPDFSSIAQMETQKYLQKSIIIGLAAVLYANIAIMDVFSGGDSISRVLAFFTGHSYATEFELLTFLVNLKAVLLGLGVILLACLIFRKQKRTPKNFDRADFALTWLEWAFIIAAGIVPVGLVALAVYLIYSGNFPAVALILGIAGGAAFVVNLGLKLTKKSRHLFFELGLISIALIIGYFALMNSIDMTVISRSPPPEVYATQPLISWVATIFGLLALLRAFIQVDDIQSDRKPILEGEATHDAGRDE